MNAPADRAQALDQLRAILKPGAAVYSIQRHVSRSGASCSVSLVAPASGELVELDTMAALALGMQLDRKHGGIRAYSSAVGVQPDTGASLVSLLSQALGFALRHRTM